MAYDWRKLLEDIRARESQQIPSYMRLLSRQSRAERERRAASLGRRGLLGTGYGQATLADVSAQQRAATADFLNRLQQQQLQRELGTTKFLAQLEEAEKRRQLQREMFEKQLAWQKEQFEKSQPKWYDYLLAGLGAAAKIGAGFI